MKGITKAMVFTIVLLAALILVSPVTARTTGLAGNNKGVVTGDTIFVDESCLDFTSFGGTGPFALEQTVDNPNVISVSNVTCFDVTSTRVGTAYGRYNFTAGGAFRGVVYIRNIDIKVTPLFTGYPPERPVGTSVADNARILFKIESNIADGNWTTGIANYPFVDILVTKAGGSGVTQFGGAILNLIPVATGVVYTDALRAACDLSLEDAGDYTVKARWPATGGNPDFYAKGHDSPTAAFTILTSALSITTNKDVVVRGNDFTVTITGNSNYLTPAYRVYVKSGSSGDVYPTIKPGQDGVNTAITLETDAANITDAANVAGTFARVSTTGAGTRAVTFTTTTATTDRTFTIKVWDPTTKKDASVLVKVTKGAVTAEVSGPKTVYVGEKIKLIGTNDESKTVYLFIIGPNLPTDGGRLDAPFTAVVNTVASSFETEPVKSDDTWEYEWDTADSGLDAGTYTIYAVSAPNDRSHLSDTVYKTVSVQLRKPFVDASIPAYSVAKGDEFLVTGTAEGKPDDVQVWVLGPNMPQAYIADTATVEDDGTFEYKLERADTDRLYAGQYFVVVQHPMYNGKFDVVPYVSGSRLSNTSTCVEWNLTPVPAVCNRTEQTASVPILCPDGATLCVLNEITGTPEFNVFGTKSLMGSDAANALIQVLKQPTVDDTYQTLRFQLEDAVINVDPIPDQTIGDTFKITGTTNLAADNIIQVTITSVTFKPTEKEVASEFSGFAGQTQVVKSASGPNTWEIEVTTEGFKPDQYVMKAEALDPPSTPSTSTTFFVLEVPATTVPPTAPPTTVPATTVPATTVPATTVPPTTTPGFGAVIALIGLGAVAVLVLRRH